MLNEYGCNVSPEEFMQALLDSRLVVVARYGKGKTDYFDLYRVHENGHLYRVIGKGFSNSKECYPVRGGNYDKAWHIIEVIGRSLGFKMDSSVPQNYQRIIAP